MPNIMTKTRLENLADGVFAIVLTLLVLDIKIPTSATNHQELITSLWGNFDVFVAYLLVFATLTNYWFTHHYLLSYFWNKIDRYISNMNILFLFFLSLLPFSANLMGQYSMDPLALRIYALNALGILVSIVLMRHAIFRHPENDNPLISEKEKRIEKIRIWVTLFFLILGVLVARPWQTYAAIWLFVFPRITSFIPQFYQIIDKCILWIQKYFKNFQLVKKRTSS